MAISKANRDQIPEKYIISARGIFAKTEIKASQENISIMARCLQRYGRAPGVASAIAFRLRYIAEDTKSEKAVYDAAECIARYEKNSKAAETIADQLGRIAINKKSGIAVTSAAEKISKAKTPKGAVKIAKELAEQAKK
jgi:hypothetical protein